ncbi:GAF domain-containing sensor histidine kinase [Mechercharimyces sp. CAU 1602]|uniref:GAF domain-containing sensor histidine kinase n=1 Tax=Mechercharimyces sp. CAU 1602 TaxID=2973933 RepID=UPI002163DE35|nr:GAF domain-containing sensor histidine kinase [Mechercharimyces sp. CAU 1602]MCS1351868.1 GAF domain-containing sensor histidine kinase [Mechercharimyces sp. CAU 1602]
MSQHIRETELVTLKTIAETLNASNDLEHMLSAVLKELLQVSGLTTGWIFLIDEVGQYQFVTSHNLPPALVWEDFRPMCVGGCWCLDKYWDGRLHHAVNIMSCKRLEDATKKDWGDTHGITHHASVPIWAGDEKFGILNVAAPGKKRFHDDELTLLQSVAFQIGTAVKRVQLYHAQQKRADTYAQLDHVSRVIWNVSDIKELPAQVVQSVGDTFFWPVVALFLYREQKLYLETLYAEEKVQSIGVGLKVDQWQTVSEAFIEQRMIEKEEEPGRLTALLPPYKSSISLPLAIPGVEPFGVLMIATTERYVFDNAEKKGLQALADHIRLALQNAKLAQKQRELIVTAERNRLSRDLHDSVNQKLFSLLLTAQGAKSILPAEEPELEEALTDMQGMAREALEEMRSLIWELRPSSLEEDLGTALQMYGEHLGLEVNLEVAGSRCLTRAVEEGLWKIGQEALNNVVKHAHVQQVHIRLDMSGVDTICLRIRDGGNGFDYHPSFSEKGSYGLSNMRERSKLLGGTLVISGKKGEGTTITVEVPNHSGVAADT